MHSLPDLHETADSWVRTSLAGPGIGTTRHLPPSHDSASGRKFPAVPTARRPTAMHCVRLVHDTPYSASSRTWPPVDPAARVMSARLAATRPLAIRVVASSMLLIIAPPDRTE